MDLENHYNKLLEVSEFADVWGQVHGSCVLVKTISVFSTQEVKLI